MVAGGAYVGIAVWALIAWASAEVAVKRGRSRGLWLFLGLLLGPLALLVVAVAPREA